MSNISGRFLEQWNAIGGPNSKLGQPVSNIVNVAEGQAVYFEGGCLYTGTDIGGGMLFCYLNLPKLGRPKVFNPNDGAEIRLPNAVTTICSKQWAFTKSAQTLGALWSYRLFLQAVTPSGTAPGRIPTYISQTWDSEYSSTQVYEHVDLEISLHSTGAPPLTNRTLYDIVVVPPGENGAVVAPHALYSKSAWTKFGLIHVTDLHLSWRKEGYRQRLLVLGETAGANAFSNPADNFRALIRYANHLHEIGLLDAVVATGDLVDYILEPDGRDNFTLLEQLIRGQGPTGAPANEPLCVPIYTVLGNHDYRPNPTEMCFTINIPLWPDKDIDQYAGYNLTESEVIHLQGGRPGRSLDEALHMVQTDGMLGRGRGYSLGTYRRRINDQFSYAVPLGPHRLVMLDTGEDLGIPASADWQTIVALIIQYIGGSLGDSMERAMGGGPDSEGITPEHLGLVNRALQECNGLVMVGMHAPPFHPQNNEYAHYFRETEHPVIDPQEVRAYLSRCDASGAQSEAQWPPTGTTYFKRGGVDLLLDDGVAKYRAEDLLRLCVCGDGVRRPVDLVLAGHTHDNVEFRAAWNAARGEFEFYTDFYSENPARYYPCHKANVDGSVRQFVKAGAPVNGPVVQESGYQKVEIPPNAQTLRESTQPAAWWAAHRPLVVETASLGLTETNQRVPNPAVSFQGFRFVMATGNAVTRIANVDLATVRARNFVMPWESELVQHATHEHAHTHVFSELGEHHHHDHPHLHAAGTTHHHPLPGEGPAHHEHAHPEPHAADPHHHHPHQHPHPAGSNHHHPY